MLCPRYSSLLISFASSLSHFRNSASLAHCSGLFCVWFFAFPDHKESLCRLAKCVRHLVLTATVLVISPLTHWISDRPSCSRSVTQQFPSTTDIRSTDHVTHVSMLITPFGDIGTTMQTVEDASHCNDLRTDCFSSRPFKVLAAPPHGTCAPLRDLLPPPPRGRR